MGLDGEETNPSSEETALESKKGPTRDGENRDTVEMVIRPKSGRITLVGCWI